MAIWTSVKTDIFINMEKNLRGVKNKHVILGDVMLCLKFLKKFNKYSSKNVCAVKKYFRFF